MSVGELRSTVSVSELVGAVTAVVDVVDDSLDEAAMLGSAAAQSDPIRFVGNPDDDEIAAILAVLFASATPTVEEPPIEDGWGAPAQLMRFGLSGAPITFVNARYAR